MQANIGIGMMAGVGLVGFEELFLEWEASDVERALSLA